MSEHVRLLFLAGSARAESYNKRLARLGADIAQANGLPSTFADLGDYPTLAGLSPCTLGVCLWKQLHGFDHYSNGGRRSNRCILIGIHLIKTNCLRRHFADWAEANQGPAPTGAT